MNCSDCPLQEACNAYRMLDEMEDALARQQVQDEVEAALNDDSSSQEYFDSMLLGALDVREVRAAVLLA